jgi:hypothetical protein
MTFQPNPEKPSGYAAYLVRLWRDGQAGQWRASAQSVQTGERTLFSSLAELFVFLEGRTLAGPADDLVPAAPQDT